MGAMGYCWLMLVTASEAGELPPPPTSLEAMPDAQLYLELLVNQMDTGKVIVVEQRAGRLFLSAGDLLAVGMKLPTPVAASGTR